jgi:hypothetical protein
MEYIDYFLNIITDNDIIYNINYVIYSFENDELYNIKQKVINYVMNSFENEVHRINKKKNKNYFVDIENRLDLFNRKFKDLNYKEYKKWINRFFEIILILEDDFYKSVDINEDTELLEKMKTYYNNFYKKQYKTKNLHIVKCPIKIYNDFAYAVVYNEYYLEIIRKIKIYNRYKI